MEESILRKEQLTTNISQCFTESPTSEGQIVHFWEKNDGDSWRLCL